jgi:hypothetical protein
MTTGKGSDAPPKKDEVRKDYEALKALTVIRKRLTQMKKSKKKS